MFDFSYIQPIDEQLNENVILDKIKNEFSEIRFKIKEKTITSKDIKNTFNKLMAHTPEEIATGMPEMFSIFRTSVAAVPALAFPVVGIPILLSHELLRLHCDNKMIGKYISNLNIEISNCKRRYDHTDNQDEKEFLDKYIKNLEKTREDLMMKKSDMRQDDKTEEEKGESQLMNIVKESLDIFEFQFNQLTEEQKFNLIGDQVFNEEQLNEISKATDLKMKAKSVKKAITDKRDQMDKWFNDTLVDLRTKFRNQKRDEVVEEAFPKLSKMIRRAITLGGAAYLDPSIAAVTAAVMFACSKRADQKARKRLLSDLARELEIVEEKIKDADANGDKEQKYELMRVKQKLNLSRDKLKGLIK